LKKLKRKLEETQKLCHHTLLVADISEELYVTFINRNIFAKNQKEVVKKNFIVYKAQGENDTDVLDAGNLLFRMDLKFLQTK
jgi:hypothetical protein